MLVTALCFLAVVGQYLRYQLHLHFSKVCLLKKIEFRIRLARAKLVLFAVIVGMHQRVSHLLSHFCIRPP